MPVHCQDVGYLGAEAVVDLDFAASGFAEDGHFHAVSEGAGAVVQEKVHILYIGVGADIIVGNVIGDVLNEGVVPHGNIVEGALPEA